jgi:hypothetical protein
MIPPCPSPRPVAARAACARRGRRSRRALEKNRSKLGSVGEDEPHSQSWHYDLSDEQAAARERTLHIREKALAGRLTAIEVGEESALRRRKQPTCGIGPRTSGTKPHASVTPSPMSGKPPSAAANGDWTAERPTQPTVKSPQTTSRRRNTLAWSSSTTVRASSQDRPCFGRKSSPPGGTTMR